MNETHEEQPGERIVFVGDSITAAGRWPEYFPNADVSVQAAQGDTTDTLVERLPAVVELQPDVVVLMIGTNDFAAGRSVEYVVRSTEYFLAMLRNELPGVRVLVQSIMPMGRAYAEYVQDANRHLRQYSTTMHAQYLDLWPALESENGELKPEYTTDGVHLSDAGYEAWRAEVQPALERLAEAPPMSRPINIIRDRR